MFKRRLLYLIFIVGVFFTSGAFAQFDLDLDMLPEDDHGEFQSTTTSKTIEPKIELYMLNSFGAFKDSIEMDTLLDYYHSYHPVFKNVVTSSYLGNYGLPYQNNDFFGRETGIDFLFSKTREAYLLTPDKIKYYNTRTPYTLLDYSQSENKSSKNETRFNVLHTQNVNPFLNFTFQYDQARSDGQYNFQKSKNNLVSVYSSYTGNRLQLHSGFVSNSMQNNENGGLEDDSSIFNKTFGGTEFLSVNLRKTTSKFNNSYFFATGEYRLGRFVKVQQEFSSDEDEDEFEETQKQVPRIFKPVIGLIYSVQYQRHYKEFIENEDINTFFADTYFQDKYIKDSIRFNKISNVFQIKQYEDPNRKTSFGKRVFIGQELVNISSPGAFNYYRRQKHFSNIYVGGGIFRQSGDFWTWNAEGKIYLIGRNIGQTELSGIISKPFMLFSDSLSISIRGDIQNRVADFFQEEFYSNHIFWKNDLKMEQNMTVRGSINSQKRRLELGANYSLINNFIYYDIQGKPAQTSEELLVVSLFVDKEFVYRNLHFRTKILYQKASNQAYIHVPELSAFASAYYKFIVSKVLYTQIGADARYNTLYYGDAYNPSTGLFYLQQETKIGNFPYIDAYASLKLKRTRVFFQMMNIGTSFLNGAYFTTPHYPMPRATFRLGVAWTFYD